MLFVFGLFIGAVIGIGMYAIVTANSRTHCEEYDERSDSYEGDD